MLYPKNQAKVLNPQLFKNPTAEYRCTPFWAWNSDLKEEELHYEIDCMKQMGMGGFHMHTRVGMATRYLSDDFMAMIKSCTEKAKKENMLSWLYDEDKWPSGFGGGFVTQKKENRQKFLTFTPFPYQDGEGEGEHTISSASVARTGNGYLVARYVIELAEDGCLKNYRRLADGETAEGEIWYAYLETPKEGPWFNFQTYVDTLSKSATEDFINLTHERYKEIVGEDFGGAVPAIFTDEPQVAHKTCLTHAHQKMDVILPFTTDFEETYTALYGESLLDKLPEVIWEKPDGVSVTRYHYHDHVTERFMSAYCDTIGDWCKKNNILMTGHMMEEPTLQSQTCAIGEAMRAYRAFNLPGVDMLCDRREYTTVKQAASAVHQYGYPGVMSELYGVTNWDFDFRGHKLQGDWQAALGVSVRVPHLYWVSMNGEAKRDYPASIGHQSAWYPEYSFIEDHFARVNTAMTRGAADIRIGVIHPIESYWLHYGPNDQTYAVRDVMDSHFDDITNWLLYGTLDFDYICESLLPSQYRATDKGFAIGNMNYDVVIVPDCETLRASTLAALKEFTAKGGKVIIIGSAPKFIDAKPSCEGSELAKSCQIINWDRSTLLTALEPYRTVGIRDNKGKAASNLLYQLRNDGDGKNLFICHAMPTSRMKVDVQEHYTITIPGEFIPTLMNTETGEITPMPARYANGSTLIDWDCYAQSSLLLRLESGKREIAAPAAQTFTATQYLSGPAEMILHEPNVCVLDMARWKVDDGDWQPREEMLRIGIAAKQALGMSIGAMHGAQPWLTGKPVPEHTITLEIPFVSDIEVPDAVLALEDFADSEITFNGASVEKTALGCYVDTCLTKVAIGSIRKGENIITVKKPFTVITDTENLFILGDFGVNVVGSDVRLTEPPREIRFGDWTRQGLPFYGGTMTYRLNVDLPAAAQLRLGLFAAPCVTVEVDGERIANVSLAPYAADIPAGKHVLDITVFGSRINTFGALHLSDYTVTWFGPDAWRSENDRWSYEYRLTQQGLLTAPMVRS